MATDTDQSQDQNDQESKTNDSQPTGESKTNQSKTNQSKTSESKTDESNESKSGGSQGGGSSSDEQSEQSGQGEQASDQDQGQGEQASDQDQGQGQGEQASDQDQDQDQGEQASDQDQGEGGMTVFGINLGDLELELLGFQVKSEGINLQLGTSEGNPLGDLIEGVQKALGKLTSGGGDGDEDGMLSNLAQKAGSTVQDVKDWLLSKLRALLQWLLGKAAQLAADALGGGDGGGGGQSDDAQGEEASEDQTEQGEDAA